MELLQPKTYKMRVEKKTLTLLWSFYISRAQLCQAMGVTIVAKALGSDQRCSHSSDFVRNNPLHMLDGYQRSNN